MEKLAARKKQQSEQQQVQQQAQHREQEQPEQPSRKRPSPSHAPLPDAKRAGGGDAETVSGGRVCESCGARDTDDPRGTLDRKLLEAFDVAVCRNCKDSKEAYELMTKADVQKLFLLPEGTIRVLKYVERENPRNKGWTPMRLYLHKDARVWALKRWSTVEALEEERKRRDAKKWEESVKRTKGVFSSAGGAAAGGGSGASRGRRKAALGPSII
ncbi:hypothetical protein JKP88DRAFT_352052 [Tribonema minus]|uniref:XPA C-terminal domain-containing protein n=1 Tax=Tribonema minus TaxID=303371 RepID=A0A835ZE73_9STRA|nr:hypothetical protein JKP88DRAFT_352052 [Tribonema minus]